jgi:hypothetical protein
MTETRLYKPIPRLTRRQIQTAIHEDDFETLVYAALAAAWYDRDWQFAQAICIQLSEHRHPVIRANAIMGLSYVARFKRRLVKRLVKPVLLRAMKDPDEWVHGNAEDAIRDINLLMKWRIGQRRPPPEGRRPRTRKS